MEGGTEEGNRPSATDTVFLQNIYLRWRLKKGLIS